jgi:hypothetical protein
MTKLSIYAPERVVTELADCDFYHTMDVPSYGCIKGDWDLRRGIRDYLGHVPLAGKRVIDVGAANGCLSFHMEAQGADVISYDLSADDPWDVVPFAGMRFTDYLAHRREHLRRINNGYWLCHRALKSRARMLHGTVYAMPEAVGTVDVAVFGSILLHLRDPFLALQSVLRLTKETVILADVASRRDAIGFLFGGLLRPKMTFLPQSKNRGPLDTWWNLSPEVIRRFLGVLGFGDTRMKYHRQWFKGSRRLLYTIVGHRTQPAPVLNLDGRYIGVQAAAG